ncbi:MAG: helix-turn-helix transcriptional regulator [Clostridium sp.]
MISTLGKNIKKYRTKMNWSIADLKKASDIPYSSLHDIESGKSKSLSSTNLEKVANALNISTNDLLGIEVTEHVVEDFKEAFYMILESDELTIDGIELTEIEKENFKDMFNMALNITRRNRS